MTIKARKTRKIGATTAEWKAAEEKWSKYRLDGIWIMSTNPSGFTSDRLSLYLKLRTKPKEMIGQPVLIVADSGGTLYASYPYRATILSVREDFNKLIITLNVITHAEDFGGDTFAAYSHQIMPVTAIPNPPTSEEINQIKNFELVSRINQVRKSHLANLDSDRRSCETRLNQLEKDKVAYEYRLKKTIDLLRADKTKDLDFKDIIKNFEMFGKSKKVLNAYLTDDFHMIVETVMLYAITPKTEKVTDKEIGRFVFDLNPVGISYCKFKNLDYTYSSNYDHPNLSSGIMCTGSNGTELNQMITQYNFYEAADLIITFLSLFPQDSGTPHVRHETWMEHKTKRLVVNPFLSAKNIWELHPPIIEKIKEIKKPGTISEPDRFVMDIRRERFTEIAIPDMHIPTPEEVEDHLDDD